MPSLIESTEYDQFDYRHADESPLPLDEAVKKAAAMRATDKSHFHRIVPTDANMTGYRVESVSRERVYADVLARASDLVNRILRRAQPR
jgi:hypothetical protein